MTLTYRLHWMTIRFVTIIRPINAQLTAHSFERPYSNEQNSSGLFFFLCLGSLKRLSFCLFGCAWFLVIVPLQTQHEHCCTPSSGSIHVDYGLLSQLATIKQQQLCGAIKTPRGHLWNYFPTYNGRHGVS